MITKKKFYTPGLISLIGLPILTYFLIPRNPEPEHVMSLMLPYDEVKHKGNMLVYSKQNFYKTIKGKKIIQVCVNDRIVPGDTGLIYAKMNFILREMERLIFTNDTGSVLKVTLGASNTLGDFVRIVNFATKCSVRRWMFVENSFYFISEVPGENKNVKQIDAPLLTL